MVEERPLEYSFYVTCSFFKANVCTLGRVCTIMQFTFSACLVAATDHSNRHKKTSGPPPRRAIDPAGAREPGQRYRRNVEAYPDIDLWWATPVACASRLQRPYATRLETTE